MARVADRLHAEEHVERWRSGEGEERWFMGEGRRARASAREGAARAHKVKERCGYVVCESYDGKCWFIENRCLRNAGKWNERLKARVWFLKEAI